MTKDEAKNIFGGRLKDLGDVLGGKSVSCLSQWPEELTENQKNMVIGAAARKGLKIDLKHLEFWNGKGKDKGI